MRARYTIEKWEKEAGAQEGASATTASNAAATGPGGSTKEIVKDNR